MTDKVRVRVGDRELELSNLDKPMYPEFTKGEVVEYYTRIAPVLLPHLDGRPLTTIRYPDGAAAKRFFEKNAPSHTPGWVRTARLPVPGSTMSRDTVDFVVVEELPTLVWLANLAALELHVPQWRVDGDGAARPPDLLVFDLDPGPPAGLAECLAVAVELRAELAADGIDAYPKTSGRKGMQLLCPVSGEQDAPVVSAYAKVLAGRLAARHPDRIVDRMAKALRPGKVFIDWSQNNAAKTTVAPYSLRAGERPMVSMPLHWAEVESGEPVTGGPADVLARVDADGDLLAPLARPGPPVPH
ncbi:MAG TPA: non-homologous end-joining DNA ligase [Actinocatenispora sp.]